ncbi:metallophosphoesterase family protein [Martelella soudanensis]|uniref:metallophosphoesterase family protein n=1 Tax=unclassified Martelella TaxID=2629616 RepID=UPI0015DE75CB|nr:MULTISPECIES: metallophosphoesterase [unclassified Martelella]
MKIAVLADAHIGTEKPVFVPNWEKVVSHVNERSDIDLIVVLGDLTLDGAKLDADRAFGRDAIAALRAPVLVLPGNHDVGDIARDTLQPADNDRLAQWEKHFGPWHWHSDAVDGWRLLGVNSQILATGLPEESAQWSSLEQAAEGRGERKLALFSHMPLFLEHWDEPDRPAWAIPAPARQRLRLLIEEHAIKAVIVGHIHRVLDRRCEGGPAFIWAAASSFLTHDESMPPQHGKELLGYTVLDFRQDEVVSEFVAVEALMKSYIEDYKGSIYRSPAKDA